MSRKTFTEKDKAQALKLMAEGKLTRKQIAQKFGCSIDALQKWKRVARNSSQVVEQAECEETEECCGKHVASPLPKKGTADDFVRQFWNKNFRAVDILLLPKSFTPEETVKLVNEALIYAYNHFQK